jgi:hypothetical protein
MRASRDRTEAVDAAGRGAESARPLYPDQLADFWYPAFLTSSSLAKKIAFFEF